MGITTQTAQEQARFAELYVEADRKRNAAIMKFGRAVQKVWLTKYPHEALFASNTSNGLGSVDISFHARLNPIAYVQNDPAGITEGSRCVKGAKRRRPPER